MTDKTAIQSCRIPFDALANLCFRVARAARPSALRLAGCNGRSGCGLDLTVPVQIAGQRSRGIGLALLCDTVPVIDSVSTQLREYRECRVLH